MREHDARLLPAALASLVSCAIAGASGEWDAVAIAWCGAWACSGLVAWIARRRARGARGASRRRVAEIAVAAALMCALTAAVTASAAIRWHRDVPDWARSPSGERVVVEGTVISDPHAAGRDAWSGVRRWSVAVDASRACELPCAEARPVSMSVEVVIDGGMPPRLGDSVRVEGKPSTSNDTRRAVTLWDATVTGLHSSNRALSTVASVRDSAREAAADLPIDVRGLTLGMTIGDTAQVPPDLDSAMRTTGLTHLTAVSGSHFAIVTLTVGWVLRRAVRSRLVRGALLAVGMSALAALVLPEPSVLRALTMALAVVLGWWWGRPARAIPALSVGVVVLLVIEPGLAGAVGLQLSVVAVIAIVGWSPHLAVILARVMLAPLARAVSVPLAAWLACWPLLVALRPGMGPYAVAANLVSAVAAFPVTVMGLVATVVSVAWAPGGALLMRIAGACAWPVVWSARSFSSAPWAWLAWPGGGLGVVLAVAIVACMVLATVTNKLKPAVRLGAAIVAVVLAGMSPAWTVSVRPAMDDWRVVVCDVGQGDMMLVRVDEHAAVVIDTGPSGGGGAACLKRYAVTEVPLLVLTHPHADHDGAVTELATVVHVDHAWVSPAAITRDHDAGVRDAAFVGIPVEVPEQGRIWEAGEVSLAVLYPPGSVTHASSSGEINDASVTLMIRAGPVTVLALGDLEEQGQRQVARALGGPVIVDLVKVSHHGSAAQSTALAQLVTARVAAISVGEGNSYGHPAPETVELYAQRALLVLTTEQCGDIAVDDDASVASHCLVSVAG